MPTPANFIPSVAGELNRRAHAFLIGTLPAIRRSLTGRQTTSRVLFDPRTTFPTYAFHWGGREELQFNIGFDGVDDSELRYGVAFSLELGRNLPSIDPLKPKIDRFNEFSRFFPESFEGLKMWHSNGVRSADFPASSIPSDWIVPENFIFIGRRQPVDSLDYDAILALFDRLLPVYKYVESGAGAQLPVAERVGGFEFKPGFTPRPVRAIANLAERNLDIDLRHNVISEALYVQLALRHGKENVGTEMRIGAGAILDAAVRTPAGLSIYEIKTATSARGCIRDAIGQLLEYALWPGAPLAINLTVVGESPLDATAQVYLQRLNERFPLPIAYERILIPG